LLHTLARAICRMHESNEEMELCPRQLPVKNTNVLVAAEPPTKTLEQATHAQLEAVVPKLFVVVDVPTHVVPQEMQLVGVINVAVWLGVAGKLGIRDGETPGTPEKAITALAGIPLATNVPARIAATIAFNPADVPLTTMVP